MAAHVSTARPVSTRLVDAVQAAAARVEAPLHRGLTCVCVEGPRLGTQAESHLFRQLGAQLVGMTNVPEVFLAREAQLAYATVGLVTDYDCWLDDPSRHVGVDGIVALYRQTLALAQRVLDELLRAPLPAPEPEIGQAPAHALLTPESALDEVQRGRMQVLRA